MPKDLLRARPKPFSFAAAEDAPPLGLDTAFTMADIATQRI
jgi:hypothetical protein